MTDIGSVTALITAAGSVIGLASKGNTVDANQKILDLQKRIGDVQRMTAELFQENQNLTKENRELRDEINGEVTYRYANPFDGRRVSMGKMTMDRSVPFASGKRSF